MLIHALRDSVAPIHAAFASAWPEAETHDLLDTSLSADLAAAGGILDDKMITRFRTLGAYAAAAGPGERRSDAILFTCSAFGAAIDAVKQDQTIPVLKPNESAFAEALTRGSTIALLVTFAPALSAMTAELMAARSGVSVVGRLVPGALAALQAGTPEEHDRRIAEIAADLPPVDAIVLGQFSMARAAPAVRARVAVAVLTTPDSAVAALRRQLTAR